LVEAPPSLPEISGLTADTRRLTPGTLYCAVRGAAAMVTRSSPTPRPGAPLAALVEAPQAVAIPQIVCATVAAPRPSPPNVVRGGPRRGSS